MNKRMQKRSRIERLEAKVAQLIAENVLLTDALRNHANNIGDLYDIVERNAQAANSEIESLRNEIELLKKPKKKSFFNRK